VPDKELILAEALEKVRENLNAIIQSQASISLILRARFDALVKVGFTEEQALEIVKARGINP